MLEMSQLNSENLKHFQELKQKLTNLEITWSAPNMVPIISRPSCRSSSNVIVNTINACICTYVVFMLAIHVLYSGLTHLQLLLLQKNVT